VAIGRKSLPELEYIPPTGAKGDDQVISVESKQGRDNREVRCRLDSGQSQMASLLDDLAELAVLTQLLDVHERLRERMEASERENERLRGVTYENEQLRNRLETSERQGEQLRQTIGELRAENDRHQKEREEAAERLNHLVNEVAQRLRPAGAPRA
jgi:chromosome segregation ATPase